MDEHILSVERNQTKKKKNDDISHQQQLEEKAKEAEKQPPPPEQDEPGSTFRLNLFKGFKGMGRSRTTIAETPEPKAKEKPAEGKKNKKETKAENKDSKPNKVDNTSQNKTQKEPKNKSNNKRGSTGKLRLCLLYTSPSPRDQRGSRMPSSA